MLDRRSWLKGAAAAAATLSAPSHAARRHRRISPNDRVNVAVIGAGRVDRTFSVPEIPETKDYVSDILGRLHK